MPIANLQGFRLIMNYPNHHVLCPNMLSASEIIDLAGCSPQTLESGAPSLRRWSGAGQGTLTLWGTYATLDGNQLIKEAVYKVRSFFWQQVCILQCSRILINVGNRIIISRGNLFFFRSTMCQDSLPD